jgi:hypothetical protein
MGGDGKGVGRSRILADQDAVETQIVIKTGVTANEIGVERSRGRTKLGLLDII